MRERAGKSAGFGALSFRSEAAIRKLGETLLAAGLLVEEELAHGGAVVGLTAAGRRALRETGVLDGLVG